MYNIPPFLEAEICNDTWCLLRRNTVKPLPAFPPCSELLTSAPFHSRNVAVAAGDGAWAILLLQRGKSADYRDRENRPGWERQKEGEDDEEAMMRGND